MSKFLISNRAKGTNCPKCKNAVYEALIDGFQVRVDPIVLDSTQEILLRMEGVRIFQTISVVGTTFELQKRTAWHITKGDTRAIPLAEHRCGKGVDELIEIFKKPEIKESEF